MKSLAMRTFLAVLLGGSGVAASAAAEDGASEVGRVVALQGRAVAVAPGQEPRVLDCGDAIHPDEQLITDRSARLVVDTTEGPELHLAPAGRLQLFRDAEGALVHAVERGALRILGDADRPLRVATPAGVDRLRGPDVEIVRIGPDVRICIWDATDRAECRLVQTGGRAGWLEDAVPRVSLALRDVCGWKRELQALYTPQDFLEPPPVASGPTSWGLAIAQDEIELACSGDDCGGGDGLAPQVPSEPERILSVAQPPIAIPSFQ